MKYELKADEFGNEYVEWDDNGITRFIPVNEANSDYQRYLRWLENPDAEENGAIS
jgi:hypothetical protein